jgi:hypothetical protein
MIKRITFVVALLIISQLSLQAQDIGGGFKVGLNSSKFIAPVEMDANGNALETYEFLTGFHVGGLVQLKFNKYFGVQAEVLFMQRGTSYTFEGEGFQTYVATNNAIYNTTGQRKTILNINNGYISIPLSASVKVVGNLHVAAGAYVDVLVSSTAIGETTYIGVTSNGSEVKDPDGVNELIITRHSYNYGKDEAGDFVGNSGMNSILVGSESISIPNDTGAYYEFDTKDGNYFHRTDFGLHASAGWRFDNGLRFDLRGNYGLTDISNNFYDVSFSQHDGSFNPLSRADIDKNLTLSLSIGFGF